MLIHIYIDGTPKHVQTQNDTIFAGVGVKAGKNPFYKYDDVERVNGWACSRFSDHNNSMPVILIYFDFSELFALKIQLKMVTVKVGYKYSFVCNWINCGVDIVTVIYFAVGIISSCGVYMK